MREKQEESVKRYAQLFKVLSDSNRLLIVNLLSHGELCACVILAELQITQPTLSHHMKILCDSGLAAGRKEGKWTYYSLQDEALQSLKTFWEELTSANESKIINAMSCEEVCCK